MKKRTRKTAATMTGDAKVDAIRGARAAALRKLKGSSGLTTKPRKPSPQSCIPEQYTYVMPTYSVQCRRDGWYLAPDVAWDETELLRWTGPFHDIENVCLSIAWHHEVELADHHTQSIEKHGLKPSHPLHGLKPAPKLSPINPKGEE